MSLKFCHLEVSSAKQVEVKHKLEIRVICVVGDNDETYSGGDDVGKYDDDGDDDGDLYIIGAVCLFVTKVIISVFKGFGRFTRFSYIPYSKELVVSMFLTLSVFKGFGRSSCFQIHSVLKEFGRFHVS